MCQRQVSKVLSEEGAGVEASWANTAVGSVRRGLMITFVFNYGEVIDELPKVVLMD